MKRTNLFTKSPWEPLRGYSRAVVVGDQMFISGTTAMKLDGSVVGIGDAYRQTAFVLGLVKQILARKNFSLSDVVLTRLMVTHIGEWDKYARAHREVFEKIRPASSIVQVAKLFDPRLMIELEVQAVRGAQQAEEEEVVYAPEV